MSDVTPTIHHRWPKIAVACVIFFFASCVIFMIIEVRRVKRIAVESQDLRESSIQTNQAPPPPTR